MKQVFDRIKAFLLKPLVLVSIVIILIGGGIWTKIHAAKTAPQYQTAQVERGTLISSLSESGSVLVANRISITTQASGIVNNVYVKNGDSVTQGQKIADITLDPAGQQKQTAAWSSYQQAQNSLNSAQAQMYSLQSNMFSAWQTYTALAENSTYQNPDGSPNTSNRTLPEFTTTQDDWLAAEAQYQNQQGVIAQAQSSLTNAWLSYQQTGATITAPMAGTIADVILAPGMQISNSSSTSTSSTGSTSNSSQQVASIKSDGNPVISVSLSEIDAAKVKAGQKATITFDALPDQTFTGKVLGINTTGAVSSGVTTYPATIQLDVPNDSILPNMSATANIVTNVKTDVLLVPSSAIRTINGEKTVSVMKNEKVTQVSVETGLTSDTQTEITSGLSEGDTIIVNTITPTTGSSTTTSTSPFSGGLRGGFGGGTGGNRTIVGGR